MSLHREFRLVQNRKCPCCERPLDIAEDDTMYLCKPCDIMFDIPVKPEPYMTRPWLKMIALCILFWIIAGYVLFCM